MTKHVHSAGHNACASVRRARGTILILFWRRNQRAAATRFCWRSWIVTHTPATETRDVFKTRGNEPEFMASNLIRWCWNLVSISNKCGEAYVYWTVHHLDSWIKIDQLDVTCFISLFTAQHVSNVSTSIFRSLRLICWVISCVVLLWYDVCWCYGVVRLGWCGIRMQAESLI